MTISVIAGCLAQMRTGGAPVGPAFITGAASCVLQSDWERGRLQCSFSAGDADPGIWLSPGAFHTETASDKCKRIPKYGFETPAKIDMYLN
ncbi:hypothetical protein Q7C36_005431 [Tachysurus vachellii]|uniref:Uncharacterized protein n=1 Tax=Tachysurus vachellii TaxID=175792 RepID=A0AA88NK17_TACVA|nr:hypothetical protein Q7C36_005431 [Tachysurus vachellii]